MNTLKLIATLTGVEFTEAQLYGREATPVRRMIAAVADKIESANRELERAGKELAALAAKIESNLTAEPGTRYFPLNPTGELGGSAAGRVDAIIARRASLIEQLTMLVMGLDREVSAPALSEVKPLGIKGYNA